MTVHICRDFLTLTNAVAPTSNMYMVSLFLTGVLGFSRVGQTSWNIHPSAKGHVVSGTGASINLGTGKEFYVAVPTGSYTVPASSDNGKILVLKSFDYSRYNSGLFRVLSGSVVDNAFIIEWRSTGGTFPPIESGSLTGSLDWMLFGDERSLATSETFSDNGATGNGYQTFGAATYPRGIWRSPMGWEVRICAESADDRWNIGGWNTGNTFAVGVSGNLAGDFSVGGEHTHGGLYWNDNELSRRNGQQVGCDPVLAVFSNWTTAQWRVFMWGDDETGSCVMFNRAVTGGYRGMLWFGVPENEPTPVPSKIIHRVFVVGDSNQNDPDDAKWDIGTKNEYSYSGQAFGYSGQPISLVFSPYVIIYDNQKPRSLIDTDNPVLGATELYPVELLAGTWTTQYIRSTPTGQKMILEPRRMGTAPMARMGRDNFGFYTLTTDANRSWLHTANGVYMMWAGPPVLP
jgi:hypothetical protein